MEKPKYKRIVLKLAWSKSGFMLKMAAGNPRQPFLMS